MIIRWNDIYLRVDSALYSAIFFLENSKSFN